MEELREFLMGLEPFQKHQAELEKEERHKKGVMLGVVALIVAAVGVVIALAAYYKNRTNYLYDQDDFLFDGPEDYEFYLDEDDLSDPVEEI